MTTQLSPLHQLFQDQWDAWMRVDPLLATYVGDNRFNDRLPTATDEAYQAWGEQLAGFRRRVDAISTSALSPADQLNHNLFSHLLEDERTELGFKPYLLPISRCAGFHLSFPDLFQNMPFENVQDYDNYISRISDFKRFAQENIELMRRGIRTGYLPPRCTLIDIDKQLTAQIVTDPTSSVFYQPFRQFPTNIAEPERHILSEFAQKAILSSVVTWIPNPAAICGG